MKTYEEQKSFVSQLNVIDDVFFHKMAEDKEVCEEILKILLSKPKLKVIESQVQRYLRNIGAHSVILDVLCQDDKGNYFNVEVQKSDHDNHKKRIRFNQSNIDTIFVEKGIPYDKLPDIYLVFISRFDVFNEGHTIYHINRVIEETGTIVENGIHEKFQKLCNRVKYYKEAQKGVSDMSQLLDEYYKEKFTEERKAIVIALLPKNVSIDIIEYSVPEISREDIEKINEEMKSSV